MSIHRTCCCGGCQSPYRVFVPCNETEQGLEYRAPAVLASDFEDSDLEYGIIYLYDGSDCEGYCGQWKCLNNASDNLCRDNDAESDPCGDCEEWDGSLAEPYELIPSPGSPFWADFTSTSDNECRNIICPTIRDDFGTPVDCIGGPDGCGIDSCFDAGMIQYQLDVGVDTSNASADSNAGPTCGITTYTTSADTEFIGSWSGTTNSRPNCPDDVLMIGLIYKVNFTTSPWRCDEFLDTPGNCGAWCTSAEGNAPPNNQYSYARFVITVGPCGSYTAIDYGNVPPQYANEAIPGYVAAIAALESWDDVTNGCGIGLNPTVPDRNAGAITNTLISSSYIGWGGDAICLDWESQRPFRPMLDCSGGQTVDGSTVMGEVDWSIRVRLSLQDRPDPC